MSRIWLTLFLFLVLSLAGSDHNILQWIVSLRPTTRPTLFNRPSFDYRYSKADFPAICRTLNAIDWAVSLNGDDNEQWATVASVIKKLESQHIPVKKSNQRIEGSRTRGHSAKILQSWCRLDLNITFLSTSYRQMEPSGSECCEIEDHRRLLASPVSAEHDKARYGLIVWSHLLQSLDTGVATPGMYSAPDMYAIPQNDMQIHRIRKDINSDVWWLWLQAEVNNRMQTACILHAQR